jgi:CelD/BcsL family acetyltransferase involved in cellulose biosynthesis
MALPLVSTVENTPDGRASPFQVPLQFPQTGLTVQVQTGTYSLVDDLAVEWTALADRAESDPFLRPEWIRLYLATFEPRARLLMLTVRRGDVLIGVLPLIRERSTMCGVPVRLLRAPVNPRWPDRFDILCDPRDDQAVAGALWKELAHDRRWDVLGLVDLPEGGPGCRLVEIAAAEGRRTGCRVSRRTPYIPLLAAGELDSLAPATSAHFRANVRRRMAKLRQTGPVEVRCSTSPDAEVIDRFLELEHAGWKGERGTSLLSRERVTTYYRSLIATAGAHGYLAIYSLEAGGETIAMHLGLALFGRYFVPKLAFDETKHAYGPGHLLISEVLRDCANHGIREFDFLGDEAEWKRAWTDHIKIHYRMHVFNRTPAAVLAHEARFRVGPGTRRWLRSVRGQAVARTRGAP